MLVRRRASAHDPEKCAAVFRKDHAQTITSTGGGVAVREAARQF
jgi:hypothetical protein